MLFAFIAACDSFCGVGSMDCGCVEADDFGEFKQYILDVKANGSDAQCAFNSGAKIDDESQGPGLKTCLQFDPHVITDYHGDEDDSNDDVYNSSKGCYFAEQPTPDSIKSECIQECIQKCNVDKAGSINGAEPFWEATKSDFEISPNSEIYINAIGSINLSQDTELGPIFVKPNEFNFHNKNSQSDNAVIDIKAGGNQSIYFSGSWKDDIDSGNPTVETLGASTETSLHNGGRRLVAYIDPTPQGYSYDNTKSDEKLGTLGVPFAADSDLWTCNYTTTVSLADFQAVPNKQKKLGDLESLSNLSLTESNCFSKPYNPANGYSNIASGVDTSIYNISSASFLKDKVGEIGGIIRTQNDVLSSFEDDPFLKNDGTRIKCTLSRNCGKNSTTQGADYIKDVDDIESKGFGGITIGQSLNNNTQTYTNDNQFPVSVSFINLYEGNGCDGQHMTVKQSDSSTNVIFQRNIDISKDWSRGANMFFLEPEDKLQMSNITQNINPALLVSATANGTTVNAQIDIFAYTLPLSQGSRVATATAPGLTNTITYQITAGNDNGYFTIDPSTGIIRLTSAGSTKASNDAANPSNINSNNQLTTINNLIIGVAQANCGEFYGYRIDKVREIAMKKSGMVSFFRLGTPDYIQYDACNNLDIRIINPEGSRVSTGTAPNILEPDFYEYGQNSTTIHSTESVSQPIGINSSDKIFVRKGQIIRFSPISWNGYWIAKYDGTTDKTAFRKCGIGTVMKIEPRLALLCRGAKSENVTNSNCLAKTSDGSCRAKQCDDNNSSAYCPTGCKDDLTKSICTGATASSCSQCTSLSNAISPEIPLTLAQCYDLESYKGNVKNIPKTDITPEKIQALNAKGLKKLGQFNGTYGNIESITNNGTTDSLSNTVYKFNSTLPISYDGRLKFLVLDGEDFNEATDSSPGNNAIGYKSYDANSTSSTYNGTNGFLIKLTSSQQFFNGGMMEVKLCQDTKNSADKWDNKCSGSIVTQISGQPQPVKIGALPAFNVESHYKFDNSGKLVNFDPNPNLTDIAFETQRTDDPNTQNVNESLLGNFTAPGTEFYVHSSTAAKDSIRLAFRIKDTDKPNCIKETPRLGEDCTSGNCNGIVLKNIFYEQFTTDNNNKLQVNTNTQGKICGANELGNACNKEYYCGNVYDNNLGKYQVIVRVKNTGDSDISSVVNNIVKPVVQIMDGNPNATNPSDRIGQAERIYTLVISNPLFKILVQIVFILSITFYGIGYLMGVSQFSQTEIISRMVRIGIIYLFIGTSGWYWFDKIFVSFFKEGTDYLSFLMATAFDTSPKLQQAIVANDFHDKSILFSSVDNVFGVFFSSAVQKKIAGLLFSGWFGWAYMFIIYLSFLLYVYAVANAVLLYLTSQVFISILFVVGPIFFIFLFFNQTKEMFDKWLGQLIAFSLQQIFLLTTLAFFNMMMYEILKLALGYRVCWDDVLVLNIPMRISLLSFYVIATKPPNIGSLTPANTGNITGLPSIFSILFIWVIGSLMKQFIEFMTNLAGIIGGGIRASALGDGIKKAAEQLPAAAKKMVPEGMRNFAGKLRDKIDDKLFDSGKTADERRKKDATQDTQDMANRRAMRKAADEAAKDYRLKNLDKLATMKAGDAQRQLNNVFNAAAINKGKELGLNDAQAKGLMSNWSTKSKSDTFGGLLSSARKNIFSGSDIKDKGKMATREEIQQAMKNTDSEGKEKILSGVARGTLGIRSRTDRLLGRNAKELEVDGNWKDAAEKQLIREGRINTMRTGFGFARSDAEKDLIDKVAKDIENKAKTGLFNNDPSAVGNVMGDKAAIDQGTDKWYKYDDRRRDGQFMGRPWEDDKFQHAARTNNAAGYDTLKKEFDNAHNNRAANEANARAEEQSAMILFGRGKLREMARLQENPTANEAEIANLEKNTEYRKELSDRDSHLKNAAQYRAEAAIYSSKEEAISTQMASMTPSNPNYQGKSWASANVDAPDPYASSDDKNQPIVVNLPSSPSSKDNGIDMNQAQQDIDERADRDKYEGNIMNDQKNN